MEAFAFGRPFNYQFQDPSWVKKVLILAICPFIPLIGGFVMIGHKIRIMRHVADGNEGLPEWSALGEDIVEGLKAFVIMVAYLAPALVVYLGSTIVGLLLSAMIRTPEAAQGPLGTIVGLVMLLGLLLSLLTAFLGVVMIPLGIARFADTRSLGAAFSPRGVFGLLKNNLANVVMAFLVGICANFIGMLGMVACFIGVYFTLALAVTMRAHAWGQVIRIARQREGELGGYEPSPENDPALVPAY